MSRNIALAVDVDVRVIQRQAGSHKQFEVVHDLFVQLRMVDRRRKTVQIGHKQIDLVVVGMVFCHVDEGQQRPEVVADVQIVVGAEAG